ncbi:hypothetical protein [Dyella silvatica]|uniref:hypothetical protein n=1 Tax=Dyella silvatica TaxID=2992128 RepID=UPI0022535616|nr:hypothetical protein [Dyella silvatica]
MATPAHARAFIHTAVRRLLGAMTLAVMLSIAAPAAHAQWQVQDTDAENTLSNIKGDTGKINSVLGTTQDGNGTINTNLNNINNKLVIGAYNQNAPGPRVADPQQALPAATTVLDDGAHCSLVATAQQANCQQIVAIENAQYQYMITMYTTSKTRDDMLRTLLTERQNIQAGDANQFGKLEDNTNKLTALYNLIALDRQQMQSVNYAYEANLRYLRSKQTQLADAAASGQSPPGSGGSINIPGVGNVNIGSVLASMTTGVILSAALQGQQSTAAPGMQKLSIESTNGW